VRLLDGAFRLLVRNWVSKHFWLTAPGSSGRATCVRRECTGGYVASSSQKIFIAIAGNIGTGKTTLTHMLSSRFGWEAHFEAVADNPYLADFYDDMARWSFPLQIFFLNNRFRAHQSISKGEQSAIQDRSIYEDANIFARNLHEQGQMEERDYRNYLELYQVMTEFLAPPDLVIYLRKSLPKLKERIAQRGRDYEKNIPDEYLVNLNRYYDDWMKVYSNGKKLIIETDDLDFKHNPEHFDMICRQIVDALDQRDLFLDKTVEEPSHEPGMRSVGAELAETGLFSAPIAEATQSSREIQV
jgi:deoxyadenosine/deoxycytidine kinase